MYRSKIGARFAVPNAEDNVTLLSIAPKAKDDKHIAQELDRQIRRVKATPPGVCPLAVQLSLLQDAMLQTCGKCVPCRDGLPQLAVLLEQVVTCEATGETMARLRALAEMICDSADCAIGYEAAFALLEGMDIFSAEYESHLEHGLCCVGVGQSVPCETLCPAHVNVPAYIALVVQKDYADAVQMIRKDNPFPTACAFVCEHPCETRCRRILIDAPVNIRGIKKFAVEQAHADTVSVPMHSADTARNVAVIGGGPSGLTCAYFLALMGHRVTVFEGRERLGGMLRYGIPAYRFPRERLDEDIRSILGAGTITARCNETIGTKEIGEIADSYDAVYVAIGAQGGKHLSIEGVEARGVMSAVDLLGRIGSDEYPDFSGKKVLVVGGGNVAMDCARTAVRLGAWEVSLVYRRRKEDMTALPAEIESAVAEGVEIITLQSPICIERDNKGCCVALITQPQIIGTVRSGRPAPIAAHKPQQRYEADIVLIAVGQKVITAPFEKFGMDVVQGRFSADEHLRAKGCRNIFVGGDCQTGPATAIQAIAAGKVAARAIDEFLGYHHKLRCDAEVPAACPNNRTPRGRVEIIERSARERKKDFLDVETSMSREEVMQECERCLRCDCFGPGLSEGGRVQYV